MKYQDIKEFSKRCDEHPDHQDGMISNSMIQQRLHEEIDELRKYLEREWVGLTNNELNACAAGCHNGVSVQSAILKAQGFLKEKNHG